MSINKQLVLEQWESKVNGAWIIVQNTKSESPVIKPGAGEAGDNPDARWKVHMSIDIERMDVAIPIIIDELNKKDSPNLSLKFATKILLSKESQAAKEVALIIPPELLTKENLPRLQTLFQNIANALSIKGIGFDKRAINSDQRQHPTKWDKPLLYDEETPSYFNYRDGQVVVLDDGIYPDMAPSDKNIYRAKDSKQCLVKQSYFESLSESRRHNPENAPDPLSRLRLINPNRITADEYKSGIFDEKQANITLLADFTIEEITVFRKYNADQLDPDALLQLLSQAMERHDKTRPMYKAAQLVQEEAKNLSRVMPDGDLTKWKMSVVLALNVLDTLIQTKHNLEHQKAVCLLKDNAERCAIGKSNSWKKFKGALAMLAGAAIIGLSIAGVLFTGGVSLAGFYVAGSLLSLGGAAFFYHNRQKSLAKETDNLAEVARTDSLLLK